MATDHEVSETFTRHKKSKYHTHCFKCTSCQALLRGSMIERGIESFFCLSCASHGFQQKPKTSGNGTWNFDSRVVQTTTAASSRSLLFGSNSRLATSTASPPADPAAPVTTTVPKQQVTKSMLKSAPVAVPPPLTPSASAPVLFTSGYPSPSPTSPLAITSPPPSPGPVSSTPPVVAGSPAVGSPFASAPLVRPASFRLQLGSAVAAAAKVAAATRNTQAKDPPTANPPPPVSAPTTPTNLPPPAPFSSLTALSANTSSLFTPATTAPTALRSSTDRPPVTIGSQLRSSGGALNETPAPVTASTPTRALPPVGSPASANLKSRRVPGNVVAALPPPPTRAGAAQPPPAFGTPPLATSQTPGGPTISPRVPLSPRAPPSPRTAMSPRPGNPHTIAPFPAPAPAPAPAPISPRASIQELNEEEERIRQEMAALDCEEEVLRKSPRMGGRPEVLTSAVLGRVLEPDRPMRLQRHPNSKRT